MNSKKSILLGVIFGMTAIVLGAFGAHKLKELLSADQLQTFETGVKYQMYHALFLIFIGLFPNLKVKTINTIYNLVLFGVLFFSGSIYFLATQTITNIPAKSIGFITPIGGLLLISAWLVLFLNVLKTSNEKI